MQTSPYHEATALPNFTVSKRRVENLFTLDKITAKDIEDLYEPERRNLAQSCTALLQQLKGAERDNFLEKIEQIIPASTKSDIWEHNHSMISSAVNKFMREHGVMPTKNAVAAETGLSRQTVAKHFNEYKRHPEYTAEMEQFKFMAPRLLAHVFKFASNGDMRAARLYFEMVGAVNKQQAGTVVNEQNNYIQVNNTILSQENLKRLTAEQLDQIESIITNNALKN